MQYLNSNMDLFRENYRQMLTVRIYISTGTKKWHHLSVIGKIFFLIKCTSIAVVKCIFSKYRSSMSSTLTHKQSYRISGIFLKTSNVKDKMFVRFQFRSFNIHSSWQYLNNMKQLNVMLHDCTETKKYF